MATQITTLLRDGWNGDPDPVPCVIEHGDNSILVRPKGYGDCGSADGHGWPVVIEYYEKDVRVLVWADINKEDPTHVISLMRALESKRL
jgi:hypothetical protein